MLDSASLKMTFKAYIVINNNKIIVIHSRMSNERKITKKKKTPLSKIAQMTSF